MFVSVTFWAGLVVAICWLAKARLVGDKETGGTPTLVTTPNPLKDAVCGLFGASSETLKVAFRVPPLVGATLTEMLQLAAEVRILGGMGPLVD